jgi:hypothetical protein
MDRPDPDQNPDPDTDMYLEPTQRKCQIVKLSIQEALQQCIEKISEQSGSTALLTGLEAVKLESIPTNAKTCLHTVSQSHANAFFLTK